MAPKYPKISGYELVQQIGGGTFSSVFRAVNIENHQVAACKVIFIKEQTTEKERKAVEKEMKLHKLLKHKHVLEFLHAAVVERKYKDCYVPGIYMLLELAAGGDLFDKIAPDVGIGENVAHYYFGQLLAGMDFIHREGVCHRDLKPENILLDVAGTLKISDFGLAAVYKLKESGKTRKLNELCGSLPYMAPEVHYETPYEAEPIDVWGIGIILFTLLVGNTPWDQSTAQSSEFCQYLSGEIFDEPPWDRIGTEALALICGLLTVEPEKRMTLAEVFAHPWCTRPSQIAKQGVLALADHLTESLRTNGDLNYAMPDVAISIDTHKDKDGDEIMLSATHQSQFTQSLLLFSQTQSGRRYTPNLTRFYTSLGPGIMMQLIKESLTALGVKHKDGPTGEDERGEILRLRVGGYDKRNIAFKGWLELENFRYAETDGSFCLMTRDLGNPISWRQLWKVLILSPAVDPHVLRK
ncbi:kinase-like domain-containing protein [Suillus bovinus]|uniref:kinase-like domain-containing protein n=1 Tax=Suillus bovinus TaxID=48563 RepID=UPI001B87793F|nr:kinase-like domain-containing protein [Suillus bovinus]KAG2134161.1 kinase-like domain-containing protein [Suillus bovinus]